tara:strand:- start:1219 stop:2715 length:1497 start_codon:yes stop_codon:yes gene_type:complete
MLLARHRCTALASRFVRRSRVCSSSSSWQRQLQRNPAETALYVLDKIGTAAFAASGTLVAGSVGMDVQGCVIVGTITAMGGGTLRDVLIGRFPVFWFKNTTPLLLSVAVSLATFFADDVAHAGLLHERVLHWGDTLGLGAFAVVGAQAAVASGLPAIVCATCGMVTATCGGLVRDVLCGRRAALLYSSDADVDDEGSKSAALALYASCAFVGAAIFTAVQPWNVGAAIIAGAASTISLRVFAYEQRIVLPEMKRFQKTLAPQPHLDPGDAHMILTAFGPDRVGLVAALARGVSQSRANISASKIITIGDDIAFMMVVSSSKERAPALRAALSKVGEEVGLQLHVSDVRLSARADESSGTDDATEQSVGGAEVSATSSSGSGEFRARLSLVGPDSPGLVHRVATLLSTHSLNITSMDTRVHSAPAASTTVAAPHGDSDAARSPSQRSATDVFDMTAVVSLSGAPDVAQIDASLAKLANELGVKITLQWITGESRNNSIV